MGTTNLTNVNVKTIKVAGSPYGGSGAATGPTSNLDGVVVSGALQINGSTVLGTPAAGVPFTNYTDVSFASVASSGGGTTPTLVRFLDTDYCTDVGDAGAVAVTIANHTSGQLALNAVMVSAYADYAPGAIEATLKTYASNTGGSALSSVPVYAYKGSVNSGTPSAYAQNVLARFGPNFSIQNKRNADYTGTTPGYNAQVNALPANTQAVVSIIGSPCAFMDWWAQATDAQKAKIAHIYQMAGGFEGAGAGYSETNAHISVAATQALAAIVPPTGATLPYVTWLPYELGLTVYDGPQLFTNAFVDPTQTAYDQFGLEGQANLNGYGERQAWDEQLINVSALGLGTRYTSSGQGSIAVANTTAVTTFTAAAGGVHEYLRFLDTAANISAALDAQIATVTAPIPSTVRGGFLSFQDTTGQWMFDQSYKGVRAVLGSSTANTTNDPTRTASGASNYLTFLASSSQYATIADSRLLDGPCVMAGVSLRPSAYPTSGEMGLISRASGNSTKKWFWKVTMNTTGNVVLYLYTSLTSGTAALTLTSSTALALNTWARVSFYLDGSTAHLRINGTDVATGAFTGAIPSAGFQGGSGTILGALSTSAYNSFYSGDMVNCFTKATSTTFALSDVQAFESQMVSSASSNQSVTIP